MKLVRHLLERWGLVGASLYGLIQIFRVQGRLPLNLRLF